MARKQLVQAFASASLAAFAAADVLYVDDDGGPGIDFTDLPPAIAAAAPGDRIVVLDGLYSASTVQRGLTIQGVGSKNPGATELVRLEIADLPAKELVVIVDLLARELVVQSCAGTVALDGVRVRTSFPDHAPGVVRVLDSADVRAYRSRASRTLHESGPVPAVQADRCRLELVQPICGGQSHVVETDCCCPHDGTAGLVLGDQANALVVAPLVSGGHGQSQYRDCVFCGFQQTGDGGPGITVGSTSTLRLTGAFLHRIDGGDAGSQEEAPYYCDCTGNPAPAILVQAPGQVTWATVTLGPGIDPDGCGGLAPPILGAATELAAIPYLLAQPPAVLGGSFRFVVWGTPGDAAELVLGRHPILVPTPGVDVERLVGEERRISMGTISPSGNASALVPVDFAAPMGHGFFAQAEVQTSAGLARTNSELAFLR